MKKAWENWVSEVSFLVHSTTVSSVVEEARQPLLYKDINPIHEYRKSPVLMNRTPKNTIILYSQKYHLLIFLHW